MSVRALTDLFAAWLDDATQDTDPLGASRLERLLRLRPDLCSPPPSDLGSLAAAPWHGPLWGARWTDWT